MGGLPIKEQSQFQVGSGGQLRRWSTNQDELLPHGFHRTLEPLRQSALYEPSAVQGSEMQADDPHLGGKSFLLDSSKLVLVRAGL